MINELPGKWPLRSYPNTGCFLYIYLHLLSCTYKMTIWDICGICFSPRDTNSWPMRTGSWAAPVPFHPRLQTLAGWQSREDFRFGFRRKSGSFSNPQQYNDTSQDSTSLKKTYQWVTMTMNHIIDRNNYDMVSVDHISKPSLTICKRFQQPFIILQPFWTIIYHYSPALTITNQCKPIMQS